MEVKTEIGGFLERNGFKKHTETQWSNEWVVVGITDEDFILTHGFGQTTFSKDFNIYWLIGYLTYNGFLTQNYVK